jgi:hypothetical protein
MGLTLDAGPPNVGAMYSSRRNLCTGATVDGWDTHPAA